MTLDPSNDGSTPNPVVVPARARRGGTGAPVTFRLRVNPGTLTARSYLPVATAKAGGVEATGVGPAFTAG